MRARFGVGNRSTSRWLGSHGAYDSRFNKAEQLLVEAERVSDDGPRWLLGEAWYNVRDYKKSVAMLERLEASPSELQSRDRVEHRRQVRRPVCRAFEYDATAVKHAVRDDARTISRIARLGLPVRPIRLDVSTFRALRRTRARRQGLARAALSRGLHADWYRPRPLGEFFVQPLVQQSLDGRVEAARAESQRAARAIGDVEQNGVSVPVAVGQRNKDVNVSRWSGRNSSGRGSSSRDERMAQYRRPCSS